MESLLCLVPLALVVIPLIVLAQIFARLDEARRELADLKERVAGLEAAGLRPAGRPQPVASGARAAAEAAAETGPPARSAPAERREAPAAVAPRPVPPLRPSPAPPSVDAPGGRPGAPPAEAPAATDADRRERPAAAATGAEQQTPPRPAVTPRLRPAPALAVDRSRRSEGPPAPPAGGGGTVAPPASRPPVQLEELLGTRLYVWLGAIALALAAAFLFRYAIDQGWLGPAVRFGLALVFGLGLLGAGERLRGEPRIGAALSAAGIAVLFTAFWAGAELYALISPLTGFVMMGLTAAAGVGLSLRQGQIVAIIGLVGGYLTPQLVQPSAEPSRLLFAYLSLLLVAVVVVSRQRAWWHLSALGLVSGLLWMQLWLAASFDAADTLWLGLFVLGSLVAFLLGTWQSVDIDTPDADRPPAWRDLLGQGALALSLLAQLRLAAVAGYGGDAWLFAGLIGLAGLVMARLRDEQRAVPWLLAGMTAFLLLIWSDDLGAATQARFLWTVAGFGALYGLGGWLALWGAPRPDRWTALSAAASAGYFLLAYLTQGGDGSDLPWGRTAALLGLLLAVACVPVARRRRDLPQGNLALAWLAAAATAFLALAIPMELPDEWLAVAWAAELLALVWLAWRLEAPQLRWWAWPLLVLTGISLLGPWVLGYAIGPWPVLNWLLYGYGLPIAFMAAAAWYTHRSEDATLSAVLQGLAILLSVVMLGLQVRQGFSPEALTRLRGLGLIEASTYGPVWLLLALGLLHAGRRWALPVPRQAGGYVLALAILSLVVLPMGIFNPLWAAEAVGDWPLLNALLYVYGLPAALLLAIAEELRRGEAEPRSWAPQIGALALLFGLLLVSTELRQLFHGSRFDRAPFGLVEAASHPIAWLLVALGVMRAPRPWRRLLPDAAGRAVILLSIAGLLLGVCLDQNPLWNPIEVGRLPLVNLLLYAYGLPALLLYVAAQDLSRGDDADRATSGWVASAGLALGMLFLSLEVRQLFHGSRLDGAGAELLEASTQVLVWLLVALGLTEAMGRWSTPLPRAAGLALLGLSLGLWLLGPGLRLNPLLAHVDIGSAPVLNWLLYAYGLPALLVALAAARLADGDARDRSASRPVALVGLLLLLLLVLLEVRQLFQGRYLDLPSMSYLEASSHAMAWLLVGLGLRQAGRRWQTLLPPQTSLVLIGLALLAALLGPSLILSPLWTHRSVGAWPLVNWLPLAYGGPALLGLLAARELGAGEPEERRWAMPAAAASLILAFLLVTLEVRQLFHGPFLDSRRLLPAESYGYSLAWVLFGVALLVLAVSRDWQLARWASLPVMLLTVGKVFLFDTANLGGLYRVLSFLGLGLSLILLGWIYQRFVFREAPGA